MTTLQHIVSYYLDYLADEPIIMVTLCGPRSGGNNFRRGIEIRADGTGVLNVGSIALQMFVDVRAVQGKGGPTIGAIWKMDTKRMPDADICDVLSDMGEMMRRVELLVKADETDLWYAILKKIEGVQEGRQSYMGRIASKELILPRPSERVGITQGYDAGNMTPKMITRRPTDPRLNQGGRGGGKGFPGRFNQSVGTAGNANNHQGVSNNHERKTMEKAVPLKTNTKMGANEVQKTLNKMKGRFGGGMLTSPEATNVKLSELSPLNNIKDCMSTEGKKNSEQELYGLVTSEDEDEPAEIGEGGKEVQDKHKAVPQVSTPI